MGRDEKIEAILAARYEFQECAPSGKARMRAELFKLVDEAIAGKSVSRYEFLESLRPRYNDYRLARRREHQAKMAANLRQP